MILPDRLWCIPWADGSRWSGVYILGPRIGRWDSQGRSRPIPVSNIPFMALGAWMLCIGWFGFNVMSAATLKGISGLVAMNSLFAMVGGILFALVVSKNDPGFIHNGALAGLVAICAGSDQVHPIGAFFIGGIAGIIFVYGFTWEQEKLKLDDVLGVWPLHGLCGTWGGIACGIFGQKALGGLGEVSFTAQLIGSVAAVVIALAAGFIVYKTLDSLFGIRLEKDDELQGSDLTVHKIDSTPEEGTTRLPNRFKRSWVQRHAGPLVDSVHSNSVSEIHSTVRLSGNLVFRSIKAV